MPAPMSMAKRATRRFWPAAPIFAPCKGCKRTPLPLQADFTVPVCDHCRSPAFVTGSDPVQQGLVTNLSRPEGNITGATTLAVELVQKRLEPLHELVPSANLVAALVNPKGPNLAPLL